MKHPALLITACLALTGCVIVNDLSLSPGAQKVATTQHPLDVQKATLVATSSVRAASMLEIDRFAQNFTYDMGGNIALITVETIDINYPLRATVSAYRR